MSNFARNDNMTALFTAAGEKIGERAKIFPGTKAEWDALPLSEKVKYDYVAFAGDSQSGVVDDVPTKDSENLVKSGGVYNSLDPVYNVLGAKNLLPNKVSIFDWNSTKLTFTKNADGSYIINATQETNNFAGINFIVDTGHNLQWLNGLILSGLTDGAHEKWALLINKKASPYTTYTACYTEDVVISGIPDDNDLVEVRLFIWNGQLPTNLVVKPMIRPASITDDTYVPYSMTNQEMTPYVQAISNTNLLDNPWFTVNQRGQSSYNTAGYTLDRWKLYTTDTTKNITVANGITFDSDFNCNFFEYLEDTIIASMLGKEVTLSVLLSDGSIVSSNFAFPDTTPSEAEAFGNKQISGHWYVRMYFNGTLWRFEIHTWGVTAPESLSIRAVKLEVGSVSTLAMDTAPNYATELLKCQRYFIRFYSVLLLPGTVHNNGSFRFIVYAKMRAQPTVSIHDATMHDLQVICNQTAQRLTDSQTMSVQNYTTEEITIMFDSLPTTQPNYSIGLFKLLAGALDLSADL